MQYDKNVYAISWSSHRRFTELCDFFRFDLIEIIYTGGPFRRYLSSSLATIKFLRKVRPKVVIVQSPSLVAALFLTAIKSIFRYRLIVDAHNESVTPYIGDNALVRALTRYMHRKSDLIIVTNSFLSKTIEENGGRPFILPDRIPEKSMLYSNNGKYFSGDHLDVAVICTCAPDEPISTILEAAQRLPTEVQFSFSGSRSKFRKLYGEDLPPNVTLSGFMSESDYWLWLSSSHVVLDLTDMPDCLVCGAYEALGAGVPMVLTKNRATEELFGDNAILISNSADDILSAIGRVMGSQRNLAAQVASYSKAFAKDWERTANSLRVRIDKMLG